MSTTFSENREAEERAAAKAGAKARRRERAEDDSQITAVLDAENGKRGATWTSSYRAGTLEDGSPDRRETVHHEDARERITGRELLAEARRAMMIAGARLERRHGIPELGADERQDLVSELVCRLLGENGGMLPKRHNLSRGYLVTRLEGFVLDDAQRHHQDAAAEVTPESIAADSESRAKSKHDRHDSMLNRGVDGTPPEVAAGAAIIGAPVKAARAASYLIAGGTVRGDWSEAWNVTEGYAATRTVPEGTEWLRVPRNLRRIAAAIKLARLLDADDLDRLAAMRLALERGQKASPRPSRATVERRWRTQPDEDAPVTERIDKRIIRKSERTREAAAKRAGWTSPLA